MDEGALHETLKLLLGKQSSLPMGHLPPTCQPYVDAVTVPGKRGLNVETASTTQLRVRCRALPKCTMDADFRPVDEMGNYARSGGDCGAPAYSPDASVQSTAFDPVWVPKMASICCHVPSYIDHHMHLL